LRLYKLIALFELLEGEERWDGAFPLNSRDHERKRV